MVGSTTSILVVQDVAAYLTQDEWLAAVSRSRGALRTGKWVLTEPLDGPTAQVVAAGMRIVHDPEELLAKLGRAVRRS